MEMDRIGMDGEMDESRWRFIEMNYARRENDKSATDDKGGPFALD